VSDSIRPVLLSCPRCKRVIEIQAPRVISVTYTCEGCGAVVEESLVTGAVSLKTPDRTSTEVPKSKG